MNETFRFAQAPNRAGEIPWRTWSAAALDEAQSAGRPVLLVITAVWSGDCARLDETTFSDPRVIQLLKDQLVPIRVDADRAPHVQDRYVTAGWPTVAFLTPTGEVLWADTFVPADRLLAVANSVMAAWRDRRDEFREEVERRRRALDSTMRRHGSSGLVRREAADDVVTAARQSFDPRNGGFGDAPKFATPAAVELLYLLAADGEADAAEMADRTLDGMIAGELLDRDNGGFCRYALNADWTGARDEKLLDVNAAMLRAYALGAHIRDRADWWQVAESIIDWVDRDLGRSDGLWSGSLYGVSGAIEGRRAVDDTAYTSWNAQWIRALAEAGARRGRGDWIERAARGLDALLRTVTGPRGTLHHYQEPGAAPAIDFLLADTLEAAAACLAVAQAAGRPDLVRTAESFVAMMQQRFWADDGGFHDRLESDHDVGALRFRDQPFEANSVAARLLNDLAVMTGVRRYRALAEATLATLSPRAGRFGVDAANFAIAVEEFFRAPTLVVVLGEPAETQALRMAASTARSTSRRIVPADGDVTIGTLSFKANSKPAAFVAGRRGRAGPLHESEDLRTALEKAD